MSYEGHSHAQLAALVSGADPEAIAARGAYLRGIAPTLLEIGDLIAARIAQLEFRGQAAEMMVAYGDHFRRESAALTKYTTVIGESMTLAAQALSEAKSSMPPVPEDEGGVMLATLGEHLARQEALNVIARLENSYSIAADLMTRAEEPHFEPLYPPSHVRKPPATPGSPPSAGAEQFSGGRQPGVSNGNAPVNAVRAEAPAVQHPEVERPVVSPSGSVTPLVPPPFEEHISTSLDSAQPVVPPLGREAPTGNGPVLPPLVEERNAIRDPFTSPPTWRQPGPGADNAARSLRPTPFQPTASQRPTPPHPGPMAQGAQQTPVGRPPTAHAPGVPPAGQAPMAGRPPMTGAPAAGSFSTRDPGAGIMGGIPRNTTPPPRRTPQAGVISAHTTPAIRDPATGMVHGPGGAPLAKQPPRRRHDNQRPPQEER